MIYAKIGKQIKELKINYRKWLHGERRDGVSCLLNEHGKMCCLGFECIARGLDKEAILHRWSPESVVQANMISNINHMTHKGINTDLVNKAIDINDAEDINDKTRIQKLKKLFRKRGIKLSFTNLPRRLKLVGGIK